MAEYDSICHLIRSLRVEGEFVDVEFHSDCGRLQQTVTVPRLARGSDPNGALSRWLRARLKSILGPRQSCDDLPQGEKRELVLRAFGEISPRLRESNGKWVRAGAEEHPSERFEDQLKANPIVEAYDVEVLVRVLLEVSRSDSDVRLEERTFLAEIVSDEAAIARLAKAPPITVAELAEASSVQVKETILMLAWAMAYADGHLDHEEMKRLSRLYRGFMLPEKRVRELQLASKLFLLDRHFHTLKSSLSGPELRRIFEEKALDWGLDGQQLETLRGWYPAELG